MPCPYETPRRGTPWRARLQNDPLPADHEVGLDVHTERLAMRIDSNTRAGGTIGAL